MKSFAVISVVGLLSVGVFAAPRPAHAQWVKGMARIEQWPTGENSLQVEGDSSCSPSSGTGDPLVLKAESKRGDDEGSGFVSNLTYQAVQKFNWSFALYGPPNPTFKTEVSATVSGAAGPWCGSVPANAPGNLQIGHAVATIGVGGVSGFADNDRQFADGTRLSFGGEDYQRVTPVTVGYQTQPTVDIYHASLAINMGATSHVAPVGVRAVESFSSTGKKTCLFSYGAKTRFSAAPTRIISAKLPMPVARVPLASVTPTNSLMRSPAYLGSSPLARNHKRISS